jgi:hypothetical protein
MTKKFPDIEPGQEVVVDWQNNDLRWACCDCNLVHVWQFRVEGDKIILQAWRNNYSTSALRRHRGVPILEARK